MLFSQWIFVIFQIKLPKQKQHELLQPFDRTHQHVMYRSFRFHVEDIYKKRTTSFTEYHVNYREVSIRSFLYIAIYLKNSLKIFFHL